MNYGPGLYAVRLPPGDLGPAGDAFRRGLALCRRFGDYDRAEQAWYVWVSQDGSAAAARLAELAELGAVITKSPDQEAGQ